MTGDLASLCVKSLTFSFTVTWCLNGALEGFELTTRSTYGQSAYLLSYQGDTPLSDRPQH